MFSKFGQMGVQKVTQKISPEIESKLTKVFPDKITTGTKIADFANDYTKSGLQFATDFLPDKFKKQVPNIGHLPKAYTIGKAFDNTLSYANNLPVTQSFKSQVSTGYDKYNPGQNNIYLNNMSKMNYEYHGGRRRTIRRKQRRQRTKRRRTRRYK
jgi:hypothetical protein